MDRKVILFLMNYFIKIDLLTYGAFRRIFNKNSVNSSFFQEKSIENTLLLLKICALDINFIHYNHEINSN